MKFLILLFILPKIVFGAYELETFLLKFREKPKAYLQRELQRSLEDKFQIRKLLKQRTPTIKSEFEANDLAEVLVGDSVLSNIKIMEQKNLENSKELLTRPWSDSYWPINQGILGSRYADQDFLYLEGWKESYDFVQNTTSEYVLSQDDTELIDSLSPSEKYDYVLGLSGSDSLTHAMWNEGRYYFERQGRVESWMGICHGWAAASYMLDRPQNKISVTATDGKKVSFYPSDIKALASLLWAKASANINFIGGRCNDQSPERDENGRIISQNCQDSNPGTWHKSIVNMLGVHKRPFIMDATYDYEVWNQPVLSYEYTYFNPLVDEKVALLDEAIISNEDYKNDPFKKYRSKKTKYIVGIEMMVTYLVETQATHRDYDTEEFDQSNRAFYVYDLELDENYNIIGGEWYRGGHPDFLWTPVTNARALSNGDFFILGDSHWDGKNIISKAWKQAGAQSAKYGEPLALLIESLIKLSNKKQENM